ncbi:cytochrome o ubiquinol oxidase subunit IV [Roseivivax sp. CAU 1761]
MRHASDEERRERRFFAIGLVLSALLTAAAFAAATLSDLSRANRVTAIAVFGLVQIVVQLRFFLHIDLSRQKREDLQLLLFTVLLLAIMAGGTLWILGNLNHRMM